MVNPGNGVLFQLLKELLDCMNSGAEGLHNKLRTAILSIFEVRL
jgi:hypothetical protein